MKENTNIIDHSKIKNLCLSKATKKAVTCLLGDNHITKWEQIFPVTEPKEARACLSRMYKQLYMSIRKERSIKNAQTFLAGSPKRGRPNDQA